MWLHQFDYFKDLQIDIKIKATKFPKKAHQKTNGPKQKKTTKQSVREGTGRRSEELIWQKNKQK